MERPKIHIDKRNIGSEISTDAAAGLGTSHGTVVRSILNRVKHQIFTSTLIPFRPKSSKNLVPPSISTHLDIRTSDFAQISLMHPPNQSRDSELRHEEGNTCDVSIVELRRCISRISQVRHPCALRVRYSVHQCQHNRSLFCVSTGNFAELTVSVDYLRPYGKEILLSPCVRKRPVRCAEAIHFESEPFQADRNIPNGKNNRGE